MTTLVLNYSQSLFEVIFNGLKKIIQGAMIGFMVSRQIQANERIAEQLIRAGEYRQDEYWTLLASLNHKTIQAIHKEVRGE